RGSKSKSLSEQQPEQYQEQHAPHAVGCRSRPAGKRSPPQLLIADQQELAPIQERQGKEVQYGQGSAVQAQEVNGHPDLIFHSEKGGTGDHNRSAKILGS